MRQGQQHRRGRSRHNNNGGTSNNNNNNNSNRKGQNPLTRSFESNGPDVKVRGTPAHIAEKYVSLARDAQSSGDPVLAENYLQHAEHYNRIIFTYREQQIQQGGEVPSGPASGNVAARMRIAGDPIDDDDPDEDSGTDDFGHGEQPTVARFPNEPPLHQRSEGQRPDEGQQPRQPRPHDNNQGRFRDRYERNNDRPDRQGQGHDRPFDRQERFGDQRGENRGERYDRQPQHGDRSQGDRGQGDRGQGDRGQGDRNPSDRGFNDHGPGDRPHGDRPQGERQDRFRDRPRFQDRGDRQNDRPHHDRSGHQDRQPFQDRPSPERSSEQPTPPLERVLEARSMPIEPPIAAPVFVERAVENPAVIEPDMPPASEARAPRRRERVVAGMEQPEFLRRPVRRTRRDPEAAAPTDAQPTTDEPTRE